MRPRVSTGTNDCLEKPELQARAQEAFELTSGNESNGTNKHDTADDARDDEASVDSRLESDISDCGDDEPEDGISIGDESSESEDPEDDEYSDDSIEYESEEDDLDRCEAILAAKRESKRPRRE